MSKDATKIHVGPGTLTLDPDGDAVDLGYTRDGGILTFNKTVEPITVDQLLGPAGFFIPGEECSFETLLTQLSMEKLAYAMGLDPTTYVTTQAADVSNAGYDQLDFGENYEVMEKEIEYRAPKRTNRNLAIVIRLYICVIKPEIELTFAKDGSTAYRFAIQARPDTSKEAGKQLGYFREETAVATG
jgi:hypothetical protein